jgi:hypothetical protein
MDLRLKAVLAALAVFMVGAAVLVPVAGASGMMGSPSPSPRPTMMPTPTMAPTPVPSATSTVPGTTGGNGWCGGGMWGGSGSWGGTGMWGTGSGTGWLTSNPDVLAAWLQLKTDHVAAMQTWYDTYKADLRSPEAQQALHDTWTTFWNDMKVFYEQYGNGATWTCPSSGMWGGWQTGGMMGGSWDPDHMWGTGYGASWMTGHPGAFGRWMTMRARQTAAVTAWQQHYAGDLTGSAAQTAVQALHAHQRAQVRDFYRNHHLTVTASRMRFGAGGWMGLGGMWGGWGW